MMIPHNKAIVLEHKIRRVYGCDRTGVMGVADAAHLENHPMDAALVIFAPLYYADKGNEEIDGFIRRYGYVYQHPESYQYDEVTTDDFIRELQELIERYIPKP